MASGNIKYGPDGVTGTGPGQGAGPEGGKGLRPGALGLLSSVVIAVASTAPAYGMAATLGVIVGVVGVHSPGVLILSFVPMLGIAFAFRALNRMDPDCGTTFAWARTAFGAWTGWLGGWGIIAADIIVMASLAQIAGRYLFLLTGAGGLAAATGPVMIAGIAFIALLTWICYRGIEISARVQQVLLAVELCALLAFAVVALAKAATGHALPHAARPSLGWLSPWTGSFGDLSDSFLLAVFIYWGWDCALNVNEETKDKATVPGRAAVLSTTILVAVFAVISAAALAFAGPGFLAAHSGDVLGAMATAVLGSVPGKLLVLCVLTSAAASTQTTIIPTARVVLSMAVRRALPTVFARTHRRYLTPTVATVATGAASAAFFVLLTLTSQNVLADSAAATGLLIAFYYSLTGFACVWIFRRQLRGRMLLTHGLAPALGALMLLGAFAWSVKSYLPASAGYTSFVGVGGVVVIGLGALVAGVLAAAIVRWRRPAYFTGSSGSGSPGSGSSGSGSSGRGGRGGRTRGPAAVGGVRGPVPVRR